MQLAELQGKRIAILGAGREGQAAHAWLRARMPQAELTIIAESAAEPAFAGRLQLRGAQSRDTLVIEPFTAAHLGRFDVLVRSPGISPYREALQQAFAAGARGTTPSNLWFAAHPNARTICVTGTKGKSTTSALLAHLLRFNGNTVRLAGNIGLPLLASEDQGVDWWVIELSSYQIADLEAEPTIAVILNLSPEHLDWHGNEEIYFRDKLRLASLARNGRLIANASDVRLEPFVPGPGEGIARRRRRRRRRPAGERASSPSKEARQRRSTKELWSRYASFFSRFSKIQPRNFCCSFETTPSSVSSSSRSAALSSVGAKVSVWKGQIPARSIWRAQMSCGA